jgi:hypothetical protein
MRMMLRAVVDTEAGNETVRNGTIAKLIEQTMQQLHPEAAYFVPSEDGHRSCIIVFDLDDPSRIPSVSEPFYQGGAERVTLLPCMSLEDLQRGLGQLQS